MRRNTFEDDVWWWNKEVMDAMARNYDGNKAWYLNNFDEIRVKIIFQ